jgi:hypothetical protein
MLAMLSAWLAKYHERLHGWQSTMSYYMTGEVP